MNSEKSGLYIWYLTSHLGCGHTGHGKFYIFLPWNKVHLMGQQVCGFIFPYKQIPYIMVHTIACFFLEHSLLENLLVISLISFLTLWLSLSSRRACDCCVGVRGGSDPGASREEGPEDADPPRALNTSSIRLGPRSKELLRNGCERGDVKRKLYQISIWIAYSTLFIHRKIWYRSKSIKTNTNAITISTNLPYLHFWQRLILIGYLMVLVVGLPSASWTVWLVLAGCVRPVVFSCRARLTLVAHLPSSKLIAKKQIYHSMQNFLSTLYSVQYISNWSWWFVHYRTEKKNPNLYLL